LADHLGRRIGGDAPIWRHVVDGYPRLAPTRARLIEQHAGHTHLQVLENRREVREVREAARVRRVPEALKGAVDAEAVVLDDQAADYFAAGLCQEQTSVDLDNRLPGGFVMLANRPPKQLETGSVLGGFATGVAAFLCLGFGSQLRQGRVAEITRRNELTSHGRDTRGAALQRRASCVANGVLEPGLRPERETSAFVKLALVTTPTQLDLDTLQGDVVPGFNKDYQAFVFVRFRDGAAGAAWLAGLQPEIASAREVLRFRALFKSVRDRAPHPSEPDAGALGHVTATWLNVALTFDGLRQLGASNAGQLPNVFRQNRVPGATAVPDVHALLIVAADRASDLEAELERQREHIDSAGVHEISVRCGSTLPGDWRGHEHFGFKDAISQPRIAGIDGGTGPEVAPGEFVLGYPDQSARTSGAGMPAWTQNGSFVAFLQLQQHVAAFWKTMTQQARQIGVEPEQVAAWIVGRNQDGTLLTEPPARVSHVGRAFPRWLSLDEASRHRVLRRGIPYGPVWDPAEPEDGKDRGLLFVTFQADLERQFEYLWSRSLNSPNIPMPAAGADALVGQPASPGTQPGGGWTQKGTRAAVVSRPGRRAELSLRLPMFVTPRLGAYFFAPRIDALTRIRG
jgi:Dyp-type peroxidase family